VAAGETSRAAAFARLRDTILGGLMDYPNFENTCFYEYKNGEICADATAGDVCDQCGIPLCPMHAETGAMFCNKHPDANYEPLYMIEDEIDAEEREELKQASIFDLDEIPF
jgi:hypothetical protein